MLGTIDMDCKELKDAVINNPGLKVLIIVNEMPSIFYEYEAPDQCIVQVDEVTAYPSEEEDVHSYMTKEELRQTLEAECDLEGEELEQQILKYEFERCIVVKLR